MGKFIHQATQFATIHNVENPVTLSQHFHSKIASEITVREHSPAILLRLPLHYQTAGLHKMATVSVLMYGSPMDVEAALKAKAEAAKADYYVIIMIDDTMVPGQWYSQAILYRR